MSVPSLFVLGLCVVELAARFTLFSHTNTGPVPGGLFTVLLVPPVFFFVFGYVLVWAVWDLIEVVNHRTWVNIGLAVVGLTSAVYGAAWWWVNVASAKGPLP